ncbi:MAG: cupredoxin domain-containing protein, partial [Planctomycetaceae bacterium]
PPDHRREAGVHGHVTIDGAAAFSDTMLHDLRAFGARPFGKRTVAEANPQRRACLLALTFVGIALGSCSESPGEPLARCFDPADFEGAVVAVLDFEFEPDTVRVAPGTRVTWINCGNEAHTSTADAGTWESELFFTGESFARDFDQTGTFPYHCLPHPFMKAVIIVEE